MRNGIDLPLSAFDHLSQRNGEPGARGLKYSVLHLQAAVEALLKARLIREHWSLVFSDLTRQSGATTKRAASTVAPFSMPLTA
ncbi:hypothetical protein ACWEK2_19150 [Streptomyces albidoflavus]